MYLSKAIQTLGVMLLFSSLPPRQGHARPRLEDVSVSCTPVQEIGALYGGCPVLCDFSIVNPATEEIRFSFYDPFEGMGGFYVEVVDDEGMGRKLWSGGRWHFTHSMCESESDVRYFGLRMGGAERATWRRYLPPWDGSPEDNNGFPTGTHRVKVQLLDVLRDKRISAEPFEMTISPPPAGETDAWSALRSYDQQLGELMAKVEKVPNSVYAPHYLSYLAWQAEEVALMPSCDLSGGFGKESADRALRCREILRRDHPDWPLNAEGLVREAALRIRLDQPEKAVELLETALKDYPGSAAAEMAGEALAAVRKYLSDPYDEQARPIHPIDDREFRRKEMRERLVDQFPVRGEPLRTSIR